MIFLAIQSRWQTADMLTPDPIALHNVKIK